MREALQIAQRWLAFFTGGPVARPGVPLFVFLTPYWRRSFNTPEWGEEGAAANVLLLEDGSRVQLEDGSFVPLEDSAGVLRRLFVTLPWRRAFSTPEWARAYLTPHWRYLGYPARLAMPEPLALEDGTGLFQLEDGSGHLTTGGF